jgi:hypothetical protein
MLKGKLRKDNAQFFIFQFIVNKIIQSILNIVARQNELIHLLRIDPNAPGRSGSTGAAETLFNPTLQAQASQLSRTFGTM